MLYEVITIPEGCLLNPRYPAAVVAGNVETSQCVVDALFGALGVMAASQGTMNNLTFGNARHQYYETLCGGAGAGPAFDGASGVHTRITSYNVCYTKLLRLRPKYGAGPRPAHPTIARLPGCPAARLPDFPAKMQSFAGRSP